jgi:hypothetical protein
LNRHKERSTMTMTMTHGGHRYQSPIVAHGRIIVAADNALYAFKAR